MLFDGLDELELLLFEGLEEGLELLELELFLFELEFEVEAVLFFFDSEVFDLLEESARMFDYLAYRFSATKLVQNNNFAKTAKAIYEIARYLLLPIENI